MKKAMRKVIAFALAAFVLFSTVPSFAATSISDQAKLDKLEELNVIKGEGHGIDGTKTMTRYRSIVMLLRLLGLEDEMLAFDYEGKDTFADAEGQNGYQQRLMAYVKATPELGIVGYPDGTFRPYREVNSQEYAKILLKALSYTEPEDYTWETVAAKAEEIGLVDSASDINLTDEFIVLNLAALTYDSLTLVSKGDNVTLGEKLGFPIVVTQLSVQSVESINLKEIQVTFNKNAEATRENFLVNGATPTKNQFVLSEDGTIATLFVPSNLQAGQTVAVVITGIEGISTTKYDVTLNDNQLPAIESIETIGNELIKITFTEPMKDGVLTLSNFRIDGRVKSLVPTKSNFDKVVKLELSSPLADGEHTLVINPANVKDYAGNAIGANSTEFVIAKFSTVPSATVIEATQQQVKVQFDREPKSVKTLYHIVGNSKLKSSTGIKDLDDPTIYTFNFTESNRLSAGNVTAYLEEIKDFSGNISEDTAITVNATVDTERPVYESITQITASTFEIKFSKEVKADKANYTFTDAQGINATVDSATAKSTDESVIVLTVSGLNTGRNPYTVNIQGVVDTTFLANKASDTSVEIEISDTSRPTVTSVSKRNNTISIILSEAHDGNVTLNNFLYTTNGINYRPLPAGSYLEYVGTKSVNITVPSSWTVVTANDTNIDDMTHLNISGIMDTANNQLIAVNKAITNSTIPTITAAYAYDVNTIIAEVQNGTLTDAWDGDFVITAGSRTLTVNSVELLIADMDINKYAKASGRGHAMTNGTQLIKFTIDESLTGTGDYTVFGTDENVSIAMASTVEVTKDGLNQALTSSVTDVVDNMMIANLDADNFTFDIVNDEVSVKEIFVAEEAVSIEFLRRAISTVAPVKGDIPTATIASSAIFTTTDIASLAYVPNNELYVRFNDGTNVSDWISLSTMASYFVDDAKLKSEKAAVIPTKANIDAARTAVINADAAVAAITVTSDHKSDLEADMIAAKKLVSDRLIADNLFTVAAGGANEIKVVLGNDNGNIFDITDATYTFTSTTVDTSAVASLGTATVTGTGLTAVSGADSGTDPDTVTITLIDEIWSVKTTTTATIADGAIVATVVAPSTTTVAE